MDVALFIPARMDASRLPRKPLIPVRGADGVARPLIEWSWRGAMTAAGITSVHVLTNSHEVADQAHAFGADVILSAEPARNGSERCANALRLLGRRPDVVINLQGDAFMTPPAHIAAVISAFDCEDAPDMATPVFRADEEHLARLEEDRAVGRRGGTTAVIAPDGKAMYFSKAILPAAHARKAGAPVLHHVGLYAYTPEALTQYLSLPLGALETAEGLEQLRFLEHGMHVRCVEVDAPEAGFWEVNNPEDIAVVEALLAAREFA